MKKYFAWVFFVFGSANLGNMAIRYGTDRPYLPSLSSVVSDPTLQNIIGTTNHFFSYFIIGLSLYIWWKWK